MGWVAVVVVGCLLTVVSDGMLTTVNAESCNEQTPTATKAIGRANPGPLAVCSSVHAEAAIHDGPRCSMRGMQGLSLPLVRRIPPCHRSKLQAQQISIMSSRKQELVGIYLAEKMRFADSGVAILLVQIPGSGSLFDAGSQIEVKIKVGIGELEPQLSYRFYGQWGKYFSRMARRDIEQFQAETYTASAPHGKAGIVRYLMKAPHVALGRAEKLYAAFGSEAVATLRTDPEAARKVCDSQFNAEQAKEASAYLQSQAAMEHCEIDLMDLLDGKGFPRETPKKAVKKWGNKAAAVIKSRPYKLMSFRGCGFLRTDAMYLELGGRPDRLSRQALCAWYGLSRDNEGHTWFPADHAADSIRGMIGAGAEINPSRALLLAKRSGLISTQWDEQERLWIAEAKKASAEGTIADVVTDLTERPPLWPAVDGLDVSDHQRGELAKALTARIGVLGGSPGTGKTYSLARLIKAVIDSCGKEAVAVCAPTGKAAVRITEAMTGYGVEIVARTIHGTLGVSQHEEGEGWGFMFGPGEPLPFDFVFVDESSMIDTGLMASLLSALKPGSHVLFVGDVNQLPPVGHGAPLRDLINANVPTGSLTEIRRNSGRIVQACAEIRDHGRLTPSPTLDPERGENLFVLPANSGDVCADKIIKSLLSIKANGMADPVWECQVIVAVNKNSEVSRQKLNLRLQDALNPSGTTAGTNPFRVNDKIVCLKNCWLPECDDNGDTSSEFNPETGQDETVTLFLANGEIGRVVAVQDKVTLAEFDGGRRVRIPRGNPSKGDDESDDDESKSVTGCQFDLGYAISCHKSQGSEWKIVLVAIDESGGARRVCSREWIYTAISRAKFLCLLVGKLSVAQQMCSRRSLMKRKTFLTRSIQRALAVRRQQDGNDVNGVAARGTVSPVESAGQVASEATS